MMYHENFKFYKLKRPKEGYNSEKERAVAQWSGVSEWELFYKDKHIGCIYYVGSNLVQWKGYLELENSECINSYPCNTRREVFEQLCSYYHERIGG
tara:strand:- start:89 stop:376 length:288 start_codon:yes stop_codon:yes gene_type:complete